VSGWMKKKDWDQGRNLYRLGASAPRGDVWKKGVTWPVQKHRFHFEGGPSKHALEIEGLCQTTGTRGRGGGPTFPETREKRRFHLDEPRPRIEMQVKGPYTGKEKMFLSPGRPGSHRTRRPVTKPGGEGDFVGKGNPSLKKQGLVETQNGVAKGDTTFAKETTKKVGSRGRTGPVFRRGGGGGGFQSGGKKSAEKNCPVKKSTPHSSQRKVGGVRGEKKLRGKKRNRNGVRLLRLFYPQMRRAKMKKKGLF